MTEAVCRDIFGPGATWRAEWAGYSPAERQEFVDIAASFGILAEGVFDPESRFPPVLVAAPATVCWNWSNRPAVTGPDAGNAPVRDGAGEEAQLAGIPTLPRSWLERLLSLPRALLDALRRLWERLAALFPSRSMLLLILAAIAGLALLYLGRKPARG